MSVALHERSERASAPVRLDLPRFRFDLHGAVLPGADMNGFNLQWANLDGLTAKQATFRCADLRNASLSGADLRGADFMNANLEGADLRGADLSDTENLTVEQLEQSVIDEHTKLPPDLAAALRCRRRAQHSPASTGPTANGDT